MHLTRLVGLTAVILICGLGRPAFAATLPVEAKVDVDVMAVMKEFTAWVSSAWSTWSEAKKKDVAAAIPRVVDDLLQLAAVKTALSQDITLLIPTYEDLKKHPLSREETYEALKHSPFPENMPSEEEMKIIAEKQRKVHAANENINKAKLDSRKLQRVLARMQTHIEDIDPRWSEKNIETKSAIFDLSEGYGFIILKINKGIQSLDENKYISYQYEELKKIALDLELEARNLKKLARTLAATQH